MSPPTHSGGSPIEVGAPYDGADLSLVRDCWILMLAMVIAWRCEPGDDLPNGRAVALEGIRQLRAVNSLPSHDQRLCLLAGQRQSLLHRLGGRVSRTSRRGALKSEDAKCTVGDHVGAYLEVWTRQGVKLVALESNRVTLGRAATNDVALPLDDSVSRFHAVLENYPTGWCVRDVGSSNGTYVNGRQVSSEHRVGDSDEIRLGDARLVLRTEVADDLRATVTAEGPPVLTRREREDPHRPLPADPRLDSVPSACHGARTRRHLRRVRSGREVPPR